MSNSIYKSSKSSKDINFKNVWKKAHFIPKNESDLNRILISGIYSKLEIMRITFENENIKKNKKKKMNRMYIFLREQQVCLLEKCYTRCMFDVLSYYYMGCLLEFLHETGIESKKKKLKKGDIIQLGGGGPSHIIYIIQFYIFAIALLNAPVSYANKNTIVPTEIVKDIQPFRRAINEKEDLQPEEKQLLNYGMDNFLSNIDSISGMYLSTMPNQKGEVKFENVVKKDDVSVIQEYISRLNKDIMGINSELKSICVPLTKKFIQNDKEILKMLTSAKYKKEIKKKSESEQIMPYISGYTRTNEDFPLVEINPQSENDILKKEESAYTKRQIEVFKENMHDNYLNLLCDRSSPAPFYKMEASSSIFTKNVYGFSLYTRFRDVESLSILASIVHGEISIVKEIIENKMVLLENKNIQEDDIIGYESLIERLNVFLGILTSSTNFNIGQIDVSDAKFTDEIEPIFIKTQYAYNKYNQSVKLLKKPFPKKEDELKEFLAMKESLANMKNEEAKRYIYEWFNSMRSYTEIAVESSGIIGNSISRSIVDLKDGFIPILTWFENFGIQSKSVIYSITLLVFLFYFGKPLSQLLIRKKSSKTQKKISPTTNTERKSRRNSSFEPSIRRRRWDVRGDNPENVAYAQSINALNNMNRLISP